MKALKISFLLGISSFIIGIIGISGSFWFILEQKKLGYNHTLSSYSMGIIGIIMCEIFIDLAFSITAIFLLVDNNKKTMKTCFYAGLTRIVLLIIMISRYWKAGWYYILDPSGSYKYCYLLLALGVAQAISFFSVKNNLSK